MTRFFARREAGRRENVGALAVALGTGVLAFYVARVVLTREGVESHPPTSPSRSLSKPESRAIEAESR